MGLKSEKHIKMSGLSLAAIWMALESVILSEANHTEKDKCYMMLLICEI